jgi:hypothetical protein
MSSCYAIAVTDDEQLVRGAISVCDPRSSPYEPGHGERQVSGSVAVGREARWLATLAVALTGDQSIFLSIEREGTIPRGAPMVEDVGLVIPPDEVDAVVTLLQGIVGHARRDGVLPRRR